MDKVFSTSVCVCVCLGVEFFVSQRNGKKWRVYFIFRLCILSFFFRFLCQPLLEIHTFEESEMVEGDPTEGSLAIVVTLCVAIAAKYFLKHSVLPFTTLMLLFGIVMGIFTQSGDCVARSDLDSIHTKFIRLIIVSFSSRTTACFSSTFVLYACEFFFLC